MEEITNTAPSDLQVDPVSPSETANWLKCPTLWRLRREWEPIGPWKPHRALGIAVGKGLQTALDAQEGGEQVVTHTLTTLYEENDEWELPGLIELALKAYRKACQTTVKAILDTETVLGTEVTIGSGRIDLVTKRGDLLIVTDGKVKLQLKADWIEKELLESETDWQLWDYAARARDYYQANQVAIRRLLTIILPTTKSLLHETPMKPEVLTKWVDGASGVWGDIVMAKAAPTLPLLMRLTECRGRYGACEMYDACHTCNQLPEKMSVFYTKKGGVE